MEIKKTILFDEHVNHGGKIVEFGGFYMPIQYTDINNEHLKVRNECGLFDVSHMGEIIVKGKDATKFLEKLVTSNMENAPVNKMTYGLLLYENGGVVDDLMVYKYSNEYYLLVVNASNTDKDYEWLLSHKENEEVEISNVSNEFGQLALQGPLAKDVLSTMTDFDLGSLKLFEFAEFDILNEKCIVSRSGYTGEDGFEIYSNNDAIIKLFKVLADEKNICLCGLGCRDTLRFEAAMPLYGHEISQDITPVEAGLNYALDLSKDFIGADVLRKQKEEGVNRKLVGIELIERGIARGDYKLFSEGKEIGIITTGYMIPNTSNCYALGFVTPDKKIGDIIEVQIRKNMVKAKIRNKKFLNKKYVK